MGATITIDLGYGVRYIMPDATLTLDVDVDVEDVADRAIDTFHRYRALPGYKVTLAANGTAIQRVAVRDVVVLREWAEALGCR